MGNRSPSKPTWNESYKLLKNSLELTLFPDVREAGSRERELHEILAPDNPAVEVLPDLLDDLFADAGLIDLGKEMGQHQGFHSGAFRHHRVVPMVADRCAVAGSRFCPAEMMAHLDEHVATPCELDELFGHPAVAGVTHRSLVAVKSEGETLELRLDVRGPADGDLPAVALNDISRSHLLHPRRGALARRFPAACLEYVDAALVLNASADVGPVHSVLTEEQLGHPGDRRGPVDLELRKFVRALVPALKYEAGVVHTMVVVQVREERVVHIDGAVPALDEPVVGAGPVVHDDDGFADFEEIPRTLPFERWRGRTGSEQRDLEGLPRQLRIRQACLKAHGSRGSREGGDEGSSFHLMPPSRWPSVFGLCGLYITGRATLSMTTRL